jgi:hypothetical protein
MEDLLAGFDGLGVVDDARAYRRQLRLAFDLFARDDADEDFLEVFHACRGLSSTPERINTLSDKKGGKFRVITFRGGQPILYDNIHYHLNYVRKIEADDPAVVCLTLAPDDRMYLAGNWCTIEEMVDLFEAEDW